LIGSVSKTLVTCSTVGSTINAVTVISGGNTAQILAAVSKDTARLLPDQNTNPMAFAPASAAAKASISRVTPQILT
jgi:hypothetical protein